jgi:hypothetical protein
VKLRTRTPLRKLATGSPLDDSLLEEELDFAGLESKQLLEELGGVLAKERRRLGLATGAVHERWKGDLLVVAEDGMVDLGEQTAGLDV